MLGWAPTGVSWQAKVRPARGLEREGRLRDIVENDVPTIRRTTAATRLSVTDWTSPAVAATTLAGTDKIERGLDAAC